MSEGDPSERNPRTHVPIVEQPSGPGVGVDVMSSVYARAAQLAAHAPADASPPGYRLFFSTGEELAYKDLPAGDGSYAVIGRHSRCDVELRGDDDVSLRHLLATAHVLDGGALVLRLLDLRARIPFYLDDDVPHRSIAVDGPAALRLGKYVICGIPMSSGPRALAPNVAFPALPVYRVSSAVRDSSVPVLDVAEAARETSLVEARSAPITRVTLHRGVSEIEELVPAHAGWARIAIARHGRSASVDVSEQDLEAGVMLGRSDRCLDGGLSALLPNEVSRAHLIVLKNGDRVELYDLASTNGTRAGGRRVRWLVLPDRGAELRLSSGVTMLYRRRGSGEA